MSVRSFDLHTMKNKREVYCFCFPSLDICLTVHKLCLVLCVDETSLVLSWVLQDGRIDYAEFAAMMRKGNGGIGRRTMRGPMNLGDALGLSTIANDQSIDNPT